MKKFDAWWMPDDEEHLLHNMQTVNRRVQDRLTYQYSKYADALGHTPQRRTVIDVGGHIGLWSYFMAQDFKTLHAFEPMERHRECWIKNVGGFANATVYPFALGAVEGSVELETRTANSSGDTQVMNTGAPGALSIPQKTLDSFQFQDVDLIKIDCEGYEEFVLRGAVETLERCKPCVIVEQKPGHGKKYGFAQGSAIQFLESMGAKVRTEISGDYILTWA